MRAKPAVIRKQNISTAGRSLDGRGASLSAYRIEAMEYERANDRFAPRGVIRELISFGLFAYQCISVGELTQFQNGKMNRKPRAGSRAGSIARILKSLVGAPGLEPGTR